MNKLASLFHFALRAFNAWIEDPHTEQEVRTFISDISYTLVTGLTLQDSLMILYNGDARKAKTMELTVPRKELEVYAKAAISGNIQETLILRYLDIMSQLTMLDTAPRN